MNASPRRTTGRCRRPARWWARSSARARRTACRAAPTPARTGSRRRTATRAAAPASFADREPTVAAERVAVVEGSRADQRRSRPARATTSPVGIPRSSSVEVPARREPQPPARCAAHPGAGGTDASRTRSARCRRPVGTIVVSTRSSGSRTIAVTSMRCGNGNAGASTAIDARDRAVSPAGREPVDRPPGLPDEEPVDRQPVVVDRQVQPVEGDRDARGAVAPAARAGSPTARAAASPPVRPGRRASRPPGSARCSPPRYRNDTPVIPSAGREDGRELTG